MTNINSPLTFAGSIVAVRKLDKAEMELEMIWLREQILSRFIDDCTFGIRTRNGADAVVTIRFSSETGKGRRGTIVVNPDSQQYKMLPGINWRWAALHDIWGCVSADAPNTEWHNVQNQAKAAIKLAMYGKSEEVSDDSDDKCAPDFEDGGLPGGSLFDFNTTLQMHKTRMDITKLLEKHYKPSLWTKLTTSARKLFKR